MTPIKHMLLRIKLFLYVLIKETVETAFLIILALAAGALAVCLTGWLSTFFCSSTDILMNGVIICLSLGAFFCICVAATMIWLWAVEAWKKTELL